VTFRAFVATQHDDRTETAVRELSEDDLPQGEVVIEVEWSGLNYKDAMAVQPGSRVARRSPLVPGVDLAGTVRSSDDPAFTPGDAVLAHGYDLGVAHHGGFAELARVPAGWVVALPAALDTRSAMIVGTAGFTAHLSLRRLERLGLRPSEGPLLVTGASGGVGSMAVALAADRGFEVVASSGKPEEHDYLRRLGAVEVIGRDEIGAAAGRALGPERWAGAIDCVGGATLTEILRTLRYGGGVAASGLVAGTDLGTTVYPFIIRGVSLLGIDSVLTPIDQRRALWEDLAVALPVAALEGIVAREVGLDDLDRALAEQMAGRARGRVLLHP